MNHVKEEKPLSMLISDLNQEIRTLIRDEIALLKIEMSHKVSRAGKDVGFLAIGGAVVYAGVLTVIAAVVFLLGTVIPLWVSALIIGAIVLAGGYFLIQKGLKDLKQTDFTPRDRISSLKEDKEWLKRRT